MLNNKTILITGGTGSFGKTFVKYIFKHYRQIKDVEDGFVYISKNNTNWLSVENNKKAYI